MNVGGTINLVKKGKGKKGKETESEDSRYKKYEI